MKFQGAHGLFWSVFACGAALGMAAGPALASSEFIQGQFVENGPAGSSYHGPGVCRFITGPRENLAAGRFLLMAGDHNDPDSTAVRVTGFFTTTVTSTGQVFTLHPEMEAAERHAERVLQSQLADKGASFHLEALDAKVQIAFPERLLCDIELIGRLRGGDLQPTQVSMSFSHQGIYDPGPAPLNAASKAAQTVTATDKAANQCPTRDQNNLDASLAPLGLAPVPGQCGTAQCLVDFKGYKWWTSFQYYGPKGGYFPDGGYFYNGGLQTPFAPKNAFVDSAGLHLKIARQDLGGGPTTAGSEVTLMFHSDDSEANFGYGDYLVTAKVKSAESWATLDPNAAFGVFTFERVGTGATGPTTNPHREIDLAELSRWGWNHDGSCPFEGNLLPLCQGNAQFTLQPWEKEQNNLHRYTIRQGVAAVTLVMKWHGANQPVSFEQYDGAYGFATLPGKPANEWTSSSDQNEFVPATKCERFHLNFWLGNYSAGQNPNPPPKTLPQEIVVTDFEFRPSP